MKILFIDPMGDKESTGLNIGIAYCATSALRRGHIVSVLDFVNIRVDEPLKSIRDAVDAFKPDAIGISVTNMSFNNVKAYVKEMKKYFKGTVILGGPEVSALKGKALELIPEADIAVIGEGELTLVELLNALDKKAALGPVKGLAWRNGRDITINPPREFIGDLDSIEFPDYGVFGVDKMDVYPIVTTRGCPYGCVFCFSHLGKKWRARSPENIIKEIRAAKERYGAKMFHVCDASFNVDIGRVEKFCRLLVEEKLDMPWVVQGFRADRMTEGLMQSLKDANCRRIWVGIETLEEDVFKKINKGETIEQIRKGIALMKKHNIEIFGYMLMGLPGDTFKKTLRSFENARKLDLDLLAYASCVPFTGTGIERWAKDNAVMLADAYNISSIGTRYGSIAYETKDFPLKERIKARRILNIRSGSYNEPDMHPILFKIKKWLLILRYDYRNFFKRLKQSVSYRKNYRTSVDSINLRRGIYFTRLPDGKWGVSGDSRTVQEKPLPQKRYFLDLKRLTMSEVDAGE
ncbi:MAG: radical SAM protein [Candidatus Omnitrophica bacterium]|nr:radical SAM protein [Candidatus Omnitrophota bacterium]